MYIHHLITYSCMKSIKMLWGLFLPQTNLLLSFHQQSSVLLHQGTTFIHLQLSSLCNWPSSWLHPLHNILSCLLLFSVFNRPSVVFKRTSSVCNRLSAVFKSVPFSCLKLSLFFAISPKICTAKLQFLHNTVAQKRLKLKKMVWTWKDHWPPGELLHMKDLLPERVTI